MSYVLCLMFYVSTCALGLIAAMRDASISVDYYVICFTYQLIAFVTLIGQYARKVKVTGYFILNFISFFDC